MKSKEVTITSNLAETYKEGYGSKSALLLLLMVITEHIKIL
jgi:hypothetical protein